MENRVAVITGANSGFGLATTIMFARSGYRVYACVRRRASTELTDAITRESLPVTVVVLDITSDRSVEAGMRRIRAVEKRIDVLVNNAGFGFVGPVEDFTVDEMKEQFETNFFGQVRMMKAVVPGMREKRNGVIINISSVNGLVSFPLYGVYSASKFALETLSEAAAFELASFGIHVVLVEPGTFSTNFTANRRHPMFMKNRKSAYFAVTSKFFPRLERMKDARIITRKDPSVVARTLYRIAQDPHPRLRYKVGLDAYLFHLFDRVVPKPVKFFFLRWAYHWPKTLP